MHATVFTVLSPPVVSLVLTMDEAERLRKLVGTIGGQSDPDSPGTNVGCNFGLSKKGLRHYLTNPLYNALGEAGVK